MVFIKMMIYFAMYQLPCWLILRKLDYAAVYYLEVACVSSAHISCCLLFRNHEPTDASFY